MQVNCLKASQTKWLKVKNLYIILYNAELYFSIAPKMSHLIKVVVPRVFFCWKKVAYCLEIESTKIKAIKRQHSNELEDTCIDLLDHWGCLQVKVHL